MGREYGPSTLGSLCTYPTTYLLYSYSLLLYIYYLLYAGYIPTIYPPYTSGTPTIYVYPICTLVVPKQSPVKGLRQNFWAPHF